MTIEPETLAALKAAVDRFASPEIRRSAENRATQTHKRPKLKERATPENADE
ncbi:MAG: hypothetical protein Kow0099_18880 [Candidatus Abyssubacteria bacterium]